MASLSPPLPWSALTRALALAMWALVLLRSSVDGRLDLLLRAAFHPLVALAGVLLLGLALLQLTVARREPLPPPRPDRARRRRPDRPTLVALLTALIALLVLLLPPAPSFADLAAQRPRDETAVDELSFVLPPAQRTLTDWVRLLLSSPDPRLFDGDPVRISGFVLPVPGDAPQLARLRVRCCLADATPVGLPVRWPDDRPAPRADQWLAIEGVMALERRPGEQQGERLVVVPQRIRSIPRPERPLEP